MRQQSSTGSLPAFARVLTLALAVGCLLSALPPDAGVSRALAARKRSAGRDDPGCKSCLSQAASKFASGQNLEAAELLRQWSGRCPRNSQLHLMLSTVLIRLGKHEKEAVDEAALAVAADQTSLPARLQYGIALMTKGDHMAAAGQFEEVVALEPSSYEGWSSLASLYGLLHEDERAAAAATKAADLEPSTQSVRLRTLKNLQRQGKRAEVLKELNRLTANQDFGPEFMQQLATEAMSMAAYDQAIQAAEKASASYPQSAAPKLLIARAQLFKGDCAAALEAARNLSSAYPDDLPAQAVQGAALARLGRPKEAEPLLKKALARKPDLSLALFGMSVLHFSQGNYEAAASELQRAIESDSEMAGDPSVLFSLGRSYERAGEEEFAVSYYRKSLKAGLTGTEATEAGESISRLMQGAK